MNERPTPPFPHQPEFLAGRALIAMPGIGDPRFERAVVLICAHDEDHAFGLVLNQPVSGLTVPSLLEQLEVKSEIELPPDLVLFGGPLEPKRGFVLHTDDYIGGETSTKVGGGVAITATRDVLEAMASRARRPRRSKLVLGYAGWGPGQLDRELAENVWLTCEPDEALLFGDDFHRKWSMALAGLGVTAAMLSGEGGRA